MSRREHWNRVFRTKPDDRLSWFQVEPTISLRLIDAAGLDPDARILDVGGGTSTLVDCLLERGYRHVGVLDISEAAIEKTRARLGERAADIEWFVEDVTGFRSPHTWDLWHDRAVFHFLTETEEQVAYAKALHGALAETGQVIIATFGPEGPLKCSGLDVCRYDSARLLSRLDGGFRVVEEQLVDHTTPGGSVQQFMYCRMVRDPNLERSSNRDSV